MHEPILNTKRYSKSTNLLDLSRNEMAKRTKLCLSFKVNVIKTFEENPSITKKALADHFKIPESTLKGI